MFGGVIYLITGTLMVDVYGVVGGGDCRYLFGGSVEGVADNVGLIHLRGGFLELESARVGATTATIDMLGLNLIAFNIPCVSIEDDAPTVSGMVFAVHEVKLENFLEAFGTHD